MKIPTVSEEARISVSDLKFIISPDGKTFRYSFLMTNKGATSADDFEMNYSFIGMTDEGDKVPGKPIYGGPAVNENLTIPPGVTIISTTNDAMPLLRDKLPILVALGYVRYRDVFGGEHVTRFAFQHRAGSVG